MKSSLLFRLFSVVLFLVYSIGWSAEKESTSQALTASSFGTSAESRAEEAYQTCVKVDLPGNAKACCDLYGAALTCTRKSDRFEGRCDEFNKAVVTSLKDNCDSACLRNVEACGAMDKSSSFTDLLMAGLGTFAGARGYGLPTTNPSQTIDCKLTPADWKTDKDAFQKKIETQQDSLNSVDTDITKQESEQAETLAQIEKERTEANAKFRADKLAENKAIDAQNQAISDMKEALGKKRREAIAAKSERRSDIEARTASARNALLALSESAVDRMCNQEVLEYRKKTNPSGSNRVRSGQVPTNVSGKTTERAVKSDCYAKNQGVRLNILDESRRYIEKMNNQIVDIDQDIAAMETGIQIKTDSLLKATSDSRTELSIKEREFYNQTLPAFDKRVTDANNKDKSVRAALFKKQMMLANRTYQTQAELNQLGRKPASSGRTRTINQDFADYQLIANNLESLNDYKCCDEKSKYSACKMLTQQDIAKMRETIGGAKANGAR